MLFRSVQRAVFFNLCAMQSHSITFLFYWRAQWDCSEVYECGALLPCSLMTEDQTSLDMLRFKHSFFAPAERQGLYEDRLLVSDKKQANLQQCLS